MLWREGCTTRAKIKKILYVENLNSTLKDTLNIKITTYIIQTTTYNRGYNAKIASEINSPE